MRQMPLVLGLSVAFLLLSAAIAANLGGSSMLEMRGAGVAHALRWGGVDRVAGSRSEPQSRSINPDERRACRFGGVIGWLEAHRASSRIPLALSLCGF